MKPRTRRLTVTAGAEGLTGQAGDDWLNAKDGLRDLVDGGPGSDRALVDPGVDRVVSVEKYNKH